MVAKRPVFPKSIPTCLPPAVCNPSGQKQGQGPQLLILGFCTLSPPLLTLIKVWSFIQ